MNCEYVAVLLEAVHDRAVSDSERAEVEAHISNCPPCRAASDRLETLSVLLQRTSVPAPSTALDAGLARAFHHQHGRAASAAPWWRQLFVGSVSIPKPVFAMVLLAFLVAIVATWMIGKNASSELNTGGPLSEANSSIQPAVEPKIVERVKVVEVPVVREKVVTRTVYLARSPQGSRPRGSTAPPTTGRRRSRDERFGCRERICYACEPTGVRTGRGPEA